MSAEVWEKVTDYAELSYDDEVMVSLPAIRGKVGYIDLLEDNIEVLADGEGTKQPIDIYANQPYLIQRLKKRDIRKVRDIAASPASYSNRTFVVRDPYGKEHTFAFQGSLGLRVYPSGTVTFGDSIYVADGIDGVVEVV